MDTPFPPLSTEGKPAYREWTQHEMFEHMERINALSEHFLSGGEFLTEEMFAEIENVSSPPQN